MAAQVRQSFKVWFALFLLIVMAAGLVVGFVLTAADFIGRVIGG